MQRCKKNAGSSFSLSFKMVNEEYWGFVLFFVVECYLEASWEIVMNIFHNFEPMYRLNSQKIIGRLIDNEINC